MIVVVDGGYSARQDRPGGSPAAGKAPAETAAGTFRVKVACDREVVDVRPMLRQPYSSMIAEIFKIEEGRIRRIEALLTTVPYGMESGWQAPFSLTSLWPDDRITKQDSVPI